MYQSEYLPAARRDIVEIVQYISRVLKNPTAASRLAAELIEAGENIGSFPYAAPVYTPIRPLRHEYRKLLVKNYFMFYWVDEEKKSVMISRVVYAKRDHVPPLERPGPTGEQK